MNSLDNMKKRLDYAGGRPQQNRMIKDKLNSLKNRNTDSGAEQSDFNNKFKKLYNMAYGKTRDVNNAIAE